MPKNDGTVGSGCTLSMAWFKKHTRYIYVRMGLAMRLPAVDTDIDTVKNSKGFIKDA